MTRDSLAFYFTDKVWPQRGAAAFCLYPLSLVYQAVVYVRRALYRAGWLRTHRFSVPVIVVGNLTVGGTGKTPLVIRLVEYLKTQGLHPGVVARGYGAAARHWPQFVDQRSDANYAGDEPVLVAHRTGVPVVVDPDRVNAVRCLIAMGGCDVIVSDDGLQHYRMGRAVEVAVVDGRQRFGNGWCLPAGPLREPEQRLADSDMVVCHDGTKAAGEFHMGLIGNIAVNLAEPKTQRPLASFTGIEVHALAGIGVPQRFFSLLAANGITAVCHPFPDHHSFHPRDLVIFKTHPVLMTEKDAIKCREFATDNLWYVPVDAEVEAEFFTQLMQRLHYDRQEAA